MEVCQMRDAGLFFINDNPLFHSISNTTAMNLSALWMMGVYSAIMNIGFQFYHRYKVVVKGTPGTKQETYIGFAFCMGVCTVLAYTEVFSWIRSDEDPAYAKELENDAFFKGRKVAFSVSDPTKFKCLVHLVISQAFIIGVYGVVAYCYFKILSEMSDKTSKMSKITMKANKTLNRAMLIQAVFPFILIGVPYIIGLSFTFLHIKGPILAQVLTLSITLLPIANSLTLLSAIPTYRRKFFEMVGVKNTKIISSTTLASKTRLSTEDA
ncbi:unnamed protein product [Bursaphelenchus okinawaensis]|uniref:Uncharacterized protein n=1 Tax=Bursaphelenchus okinawaensis TaxID=465554 RepID=A0A811K142_9BILA|nr:unnamed protein product [Bursaphelenchus okinawaensis]CAG9089664.1 unnamed protein product [Bursaphelenchus okinawaensis]